MKTRELNDEISLNKNFRIDGFCKIVRGNTGLKKDELLDAGDYVALQYGKTYKVDVVDETFNFFVNEEYFKESQVVNQGDTILISTSETIEDLGHSCFYDRKDLGLLGGEQILLKPKSNSINGKYLYYFSKFFKTELQKYATGLKVFRFNIDDLKRISFHIPPLPEQTAIANYLDQKTTTIDKKTELLNQKIENYKKLRKAIINKAVTKGLDNKVELKESEIDWIGKIPKHWEVKRFKEFAQTIKGKNLEFYETQVENSLPNLSLEYLRNDSVVFETYVKADDKNLIANENDLIIIWDGAGVGEILYGKKGVISSTTAKLKFSNIINAQFFSFLRFNVEYRLKNIPTGMGIPHLNPNELKNFMCPIPPIKEQSQIAEYLDQKTATIDKMVENLQTQITTLQHLRKVLINDAVTGKIKVV
ncbi:MAG: hypothetical protein BGO40_07280 [Chryseobacterium sp. 39-10]|nr:restriction endonuclease subunit S [Chryseobacterium sp.]OJV45727.1 MAG: hypothetical protein BGO40_07280 [Chryseobacterium sp. 39-10]